VNDQFHAAGEISSQQILIANAAELVGVEKISLAELQFPFLLLSK